MASNLSFRSLIHFEFIFIYGVKECSKFILLHIVSSFFSSTLMEKTVFSPLHVLASFHRLIHGEYMGSFLASLFCSTYLGVCFSASTILF